MLHGQEIIAKRSALLMTLLCCLFYSASLAQTNSTATIATRSVEGVIVDSASQHPLSYVTVVLQDGERDTPVKTVLTNKDGFFELNRLPAKPYRLVFSCVGYKTRSIELPAFTSSVLHLGTITLAFTLAPLKEVRIITQKQLIEQDVDKIIYNADADTESEMLSAFDMLQKVPLLSVDADDNLQLNGRDNYQIVINGKTSTLFVHNPSDVLKTMPAHSIKTIEVITNPSARYGADGAGGIINIITYKETISGYNGSVAAWANKPSASSANGYLTAKVGKFGASANLGNNTYNSPINSSALFREDKTEHNRLQQTGESKTNTHSHYAGSELSYEPNVFNLITADYSTNKGRGDAYFTQQAKLFNAAGSIEQAYNRQSAGTNESYGREMSLDIQHSFKKNTEQSLHLSYLSSLGTNQSSTDFVLQPLINYKGQTSTTSNEDGSKQHTMQVDYIQPIKKQTLELGVKSVVSVNNSDYFYKNQDSGTGAFLLDQRFSNSFNYSEKIYAAYASLNLKITNWGLRLGARAEKTKTDANFKSSGTIVFQNYCNLLPNLLLSVRLKKTSAIRLSYTQHIERPAMSYLNPYTDATDPRNISFGNPQLRPGKVHLFNLGYTAFKKSTSLNLNFIYNYTNNAIQQFTTLGTDTIARTSFGNVGKSQTYGFTLNGSTVLFKKLNISINSINDLARFINSAGSKLEERKGFMFSLSGTTSYRFSKGWKVSASFGYSSSRVLLQGKATGCSWNSAAITKTFFKDHKASIGFTVRSLLQNNRSSFTEINDFVFYQRWESDMVIRQYNVSFSYRFGKVQAGSGPKN